jgi:SAM-dependent methyltransferase
MSWKDWGRSVRDAWFFVIDPKRPAERRGERVVFRHLSEDRFLDGLKGARILEIGPKHGEDSVLLASLEPLELVLVELPEKTEQLRSWLPRLACRTTHVEGNLLYLPPSTMERLGRFDLVWCLGVLYHNVEQLRLLRTLFRLTADEGRVVIESATTRNAALADLNVVELHWPRTYRELPTITHLPSRRAIQSWMEMVGFTEVELRSVYSRELASQRAVITARRSKASKPYVSYGTDGSNPEYVAGESS